MALSTFLFSSPLMLAGEGAGERALDLFSNTSNKQTNNLTINKQKP